MLGKSAFDHVALLASGARTAATGTGDATRLPRSMRAVALELDLTAAATAAGDKLDVYVQTKVDGTNWLDVQRFTQALGNGGAKRFITKVTAGLATAEFDNATGLGAAALRNVLGDEWRVRWVITDAGAASFTFAVHACPMM